MDCELRIKPADNGFVLEYEDPAIRMANRGDGPWQDPWRKRVYATADELKADLDKLLPIFVEYASKPEPSNQNFSSVLSEALQEKN